MKCLLYTGIVISLLCSCSEKDILPGDNELARTPLQVVSANLYPDLRILTRDVPESVGLSQGLLEFIWKVLRQMKMAISSLDMRTSRTGTMPMIAVPQRGSLPIAKK